MVQPLSLALLGNGADVYRLRRDDSTPRGKNEQFLLLSCRDMIVQLL